MTATNTITLALLRSMLHGVDPANPTQLRSIYDSLLITANANQPALSSITYLAASEVSIEAAIGYFRLKNLRVKRFGISKTIIPEYVLDLQNGVAQWDKTNWFVDEGVRIVTTAWGNQSSLCRRTIIDLVLTDAMCRACNVMRMTNGEGEEYLSTTPLQNPVKAHPETKFTYTVYDKVGGAVLISGHCDLVFSYSNDAEPVPENVFLGLIEIKKPEEFEQGFMELLSYLGTLHQARIRKKYADSSAYGIVTDGLQYYFLKIDNASIVYRSSTYNLIEHSEKISHYIFVIFTSTTMMHPASNDAEVCLATPGVAPPKVNPLEQA